MPDDNANLETLAMVGALLVEDLIFGCGIPLPLDGLLEHRLVITLMIVGERLVNVGLDMLENKFSGRLQAAVEIDRPDNRLENRRRDRTWQFRRRWHALAQRQLTAKGQRLRNLRTGVARDHCGFDLGHLAFFQVGMFFKEPLTDDHAENYIA